MLGRPFVVGVSGRHRGIHLAHVAAAVHALVDTLPGPVGSEVAFGGGQASEGGVSRAGIVGQVTGHRDGGGSAVLETAVTDLHFAGDEFKGKQTVGDEPLGVTVGVRVVDFHAGFVEVFDHAVGVRFGLVVAFVADPEGLAPEPGAVGLPGGDWTVRLLPDFLEIAIAKSCGGAGGAKGSYKPGGQGGHENNY